METGVVTIQVEEYRKLLREQIILEAIVDGVKKGQYSIDPTLKEILGIPQKVKAAEPEGPDDHR